MSQTARPIDREPLLVAAKRASVVQWQPRPGLCPVARAPNVITKRFQLTKIKKFAGLIRVQHRVAAENVVFQDAREIPCYAGIGGVSPAGLPKVGQNAVELPPAYCHLVAVGR